MQVSDCRSGKKTSDPLSRWRSDRPTDRPTGIQRTQVDDSYKNKKQKTKLRVPTSDFVQGDR